MAWYGDIVYVAIAKLTVAIGESHSLKDKRMVVRRVKDRVRERLGVVINEVGALDDWHRAELGCAVVSGDRPKAGELIDEAIRAVQAAAESGDAQIVAIARDIMTFDQVGAPYEAPSPELAERTGAGDKANADADWIPDAWKDRA